MALFGLGVAAVKTAVNIFSNRQETKRLEALAEMRHMERMAKGEIEFQKTAQAAQDNSWKDEFVLVVVSLPILVLAYAVFFGDTAMKEKLDLFFNYFNTLPQWYQWLLIGIFGAIYGLKPMTGMIGKK